jgi:Domain of unknown function (DUF2341)
MAHVRVWALFLPFAASGCNLILGFDDPTPGLVTALPICGGGWPYRIQATIDNTSGSVLQDYQVPVVLDTSSPIQLGKMNPNGSDLRVVSEDGASLLAYAVDKDLGTTRTVIWVRVPTVPTAESTISLYYGNPSAEERSSIEDTFIPGIIQNPGFETGGAWTTDPAENVTRWEMAWPGSVGWVSEGSGSLFVDLEQDGLNKGPMTMDIHQPVTFPPGNDSVLRFDLHVIAASQGELGGEFSWTAGGENGGLWELNSRHGTIAYTHLGEETIPISPGPTDLAFHVAIHEEQGGYAEGMLDNLRVRKHVSPEPSVTLGLEQSLCP